MGRGKLRMELIADKTTRRSTFQKRRKGLQKKARELQTLCDVDVLVVAFDDRDQQQPVLWPEDPAEAQRFAENYTKKKHSQKATREEEVVSLASSSSLPCPALAPPEDDDQVNGLVEDLVDIERKLAMIKNRINFVEEKKDEESAIFHGAEMNHELPEVPSSLSYAYPLDYSLYDVGELQQHDSSTATAAGWPGQGDYSGFGDIIPCNHYISNWLDFLSPLRPLDPHEPQELSFNGGTGMLEDVAWKLADGYLQPW